MITVGAKLPEFTLQAVPGGPLGLAGALGILHPQEGVALRATFLVEPDGVVRWVNVNDPGLRPSSVEVARVLRRQARNERRAGAHASCVGDEPAV